MNQKIKQNETWKWSNGEVIISSDNAIQLIKLVNDYKSGNMNIQKLKQNDNVSIVAKAFQLFDKWTKQKGKTK